jgi:hypothetical protein
VEGEVQSKAVAVAVGVERPALDGPVDTSIPRGVLYRWNGHFTDRARGPKAQAALVQLMNTAAMEHGTLNTLERVNGNRHRCLSMVDDV